MTKKLLKISAGALIAVSLCAAPATFYAATPEEAEAIARQYGISEDILQSCWNEFYTNPELYPPEVIDDMIEQLIAAKDKIVTNVPHDPDAVVPDVVTTVVDTSVPQETGADVPSEPVHDDSITLTMPDGSEINRISKEQFIALSYDEKMTYLSTFTDEQQTVIINNLSPEEYKSMLKQLPNDDKLLIVDDLTNMVDDFGINMTVDEISGDNISYSMKNSDGELIGAGSFKETVDNTGYDRRGIFTLCGALVFAGIAGLFVLVKNCFRKDSQNE